MANVLARIKLKNKNFEISVDLDEALKVKDGTGNVSSALNSNSVYYDLKKGTVVSLSDLKDSFGTDDIYQIAERIMKNGEIQKNQEYRESERDEKIKQVISLIIQNSSDQHGRPFTEERIKKAMEEIHYNFDNRPAEQQMTDLVNELKKIIPIKIEVKRIKIVIPASFTGQVYGLISSYKETEEWLDNGDLEVILNIPAGIQIDFYEKLNSITHGAIQSEDLS
ncbi:ribosome assembly factor SBDS [Candidatus Parvarchaeota archaeon]|jgi:ribosome maturation protein SDO1|nr:MAG: ribosome assembly factor SBDS [Candidatus Parvarchaeota archaeon]HIG51878.1 ribosome assembly factor SBDS [Candidatus Pacearchaeota archaeon]